MRLIWAFEWIQEAESDPQRVTRVRITHGVMMQTSEVRQATTYTIRNDDTTPRTVLIEHPLRPGWTDHCRKRKPQAGRNHIEREPFPRERGGKSD